MSVRQTVEKQAHIKEADCTPIRNCRGMSDPFFFAVDVISKKEIVIHCVIMTSFVVTDESENVFTICSGDRDPRIQRFTEFVWANYLKERKKKFKDDEKLKEAIVEAMTTEDCKEFLEIIKARQTAAKEALAAKYANFDIVLEEAEEKGLSGEELKEYMEDKLKPKNQNEQQNQS